MPLPSKIDALIRQRFKELFAESEQLVQDMIQEENKEINRLRAANIGYIGTFHVAEESFFSIRTKTLTLIQLLSSNNEHLVQTAREIRELVNSVEDGRKLRGYIAGLENDYNAGMFERLVEMVEADIAADYLGQAEHLLEEGQPGKFDHVPAAVLLGAILEDALRRLCGRQTPPVSVVDAKGSPKTLNPLVDELKKVGLYNELKAKQLRAWADIRNAAAHGEFGKFTRQDVEQMRVGVQNFLADYL
jgi:hypothetical protein